MAINLSNCIKLQKAICAKPRRPTGFRYGHFAPPAYLGFVRLTPASHGPRRPGAVRPVHQSFHPAGPVLPVACSGTGDSSRPLHGRLRDLNRFATTPRGVSHSIIPLVGQTAPGLKDREGLSWLSPAPAALPARLAAPSPSVQLRFRHRRVSAAFAGMTPPSVIARTERIPRELARLDSTTM